MPKTARIQLTLHVDDIQMPDFDALLLVSFGGPEGPADVIPFLENVLRGKNVPRQRMLEVAEHYQQFGGVSPINKQNRALLNAIQEELASHDIPLPVYWGNRNWHPFIPETLQELKRDGHRNILTFMTSAYSSYSGCRQYREDLDRAQKDLGDVTLKFNKLRVFYNHPGFIESFADHLSKSLAQFDTPESVRVLFTAHSIPIAMATHCQYESQLQEACRLVCQTLDHSSFELVYQSRSGPPNQPWLEPDICDRIRELKSETDLTSVIIAPIG
ncbi:MAG: ferrochelatase, partial [Planctomycetota bacterium]|nr:ferrochelatase [Planctomycetota bacterium]